MGAFRRCRRCERSPVARCGRCDAPLCGRHAPVPARRCRPCERDYQDEAIVRNRLKAVLGLPPAAIAGVSVFAVLLPLAGLGIAGSLIIATGAALASTGTAATVFRGIDRVARAQFLREHGRALPEARLVLR